MCIRSAAARTDPTAACPSSIPYILFSIILARYVLRWRFHPLHQQTTQGSAGDSCLRQLQYVASMPFSSEYVHRRWCEPEQDVAKPPVNGPWKECAGQAIEGMILDSPFDFWHKQRSLHVFLQTRKRPSQPVGRKILFELPSKGRVDLGNLSPYQTLHMPTSVRPRAAFPLALSDGLLCGRPLLEPRLRS